MNSNRSYFKLASALCLCAALWFAFGGVIKLLVAYSQNKPIEMVVCSGAGMKKIYVQASGETVSPEIVLKHCSNTPMALMPSEWEMPKNLAYASPRSQSIIALANIAPDARRWLQNGRPPPGRAPPSLSYSAG